MEWAMRRLSIMILGVMIFSAALGAFAYRLLATPTPQAVRIAVAETGPRTALSPYERRVPEAAARPTSRPASSRATGWHAFEVVLNIANLVIGILGIWMTVVGMRLQRAVAT
jgi:hypothetical protein